MPKTLVDDDELPNVPPPKMLLLGAGLEVAEVEKKLGIAEADFSGTLNGFDDTLLSGLSMGLPKMLPVLVAPNGLEEDLLAVVALDPKEPNKEGVVLLELDEEPKPKDGAAAVEVGAVLLGVEVPKVKPVLLVSDGRVKALGVAEEPKTEGEGLKPVELGPFEDGAAVLLGGEVAGGSLKPPNPANVGGGAGMAGMADTAGFSTDGVVGVGAGCDDCLLVDASPNSACTFVRKDLYFSNALVRSTYGSSCTNFVIDDTREVFNPRRFL